MMFVFLLHCLDCCIIIILIIFCIESFPFLCIDIVIVCFLVWLYFNFFFVICVCACAQITHLKCVNVGASLSHGRREKEWSTIMIKPHRSLRRKSPLWLRPFQFNFMLLGSNRPKFWQMSFSNYSLRRLVPGLVWEGLDHFWIRYYSTCSC